MNDLICLKLRLGKNTFRFSSAILSNNLPTSIKEATSHVSRFKNFLRFHLSHQLFLINIILPNFDSCLIFLDLKQIMMICSFPFRHFLKSLYMILK